MMKLKWFAIVCMCIFSLAGCFSPAPQETNIKQNSLKPQKKSQKVQAIEEKLKNLEVSMDFTEVPLKEVVQYLANTVGVPFAIDPDIYIAFPEKEALLLDITTNKLKLGATLELITSLKGISYQIKNNSIVLTTLKHGPQNPSLRLYDVRDLTGKLADFPGPEINLQAVQREREEGPFFGHRVIKLQRQISDGNTIPPSNSQKKAPKLWKQPLVQTNTAHINVGRQESLELKKVRVMVKIEGLRARTIVDHVFYNPHKQQLEGDFRYRLPDNASICYFAFYPNLEPKENIKIGDKSIELPSLPQGNTVYETSVKKLFAEEQNPFGAPKIAYVVPRQKALMAYEKIVRRTIDPALVQWMGGNVFSARVFPLQAKKYQRVVIAYEQTLPKSKNRCDYKFFFPKKKSVDIDFLLVADKAHAAQAQFNLAKPHKVSQNWVSYSYQSQRKKSLYSYAQYDFPSNNSEFIAGSDNKTTYVYGRLSPQLPVVDSVATNSSAIFLLDTSFSQQPETFGVYIKLLQKMLESNSEIKRFNIMFFNVETSWIKDGWIENTFAMRKKLLADLDNILLEGATDIEAVLITLNKTPWLKDIATDVFLFSDGENTWGKATMSQVVANFKKKLNFNPRFYCYPLGLGSRNRELFPLLQDFGGNTFSISAQTQLKTLAMAHKKAAFFVEKVSSYGLEDLLTVAKIKTIYPGQQILVAAKMLGKNPKITIAGTFQGKKKKLVFPIVSALKGTLAPRAFGEMAVKKMERLNNPALEKTIIAFARYFAVPGKTCSLLMLESKEDYKAFQINTTKDKKAIAAIKVKKLLEKAPHLQKPPKNAAVAFWYSVFWRSLQKKWGTPPKNTGHVEALLKLVSSKDFVIEKETFSCKLHTTSQIPSTYIQVCKKTPDDYRNYFKEAERRFSQGWTKDYIRCLSSIVEQELNNSPALRMVGSLLLHKKLPLHSINLFLQVQSKRPSEPQSYRDLARSCAGFGKYMAAAFYYEIVLAGVWEDRFGGIKTIVVSEYTQMIQKLLNKKNMSTSQIDFFTKRLKQLSKYAYKKADILVTVTWNTNDTDVDLWITEPGGEKCSYNNKRTKSGGRLLDDITQGYGPEFYSLKKASTGTYAIDLHYYASNRNRISDITFAEVKVILKAGSKNEKNFSFYTLLNSKNNKKTIYKFSWPVLEK